MNIIFPWKDLVFTDLPSKKLKNIITQDISGSDTYFTATTYYNGFSEAKLGYCNENGNGYSKRSLDS